MELISRNIKIDFLGKALVPMLLSLFLVLASFYVWYAQGETKYGVDFKGGNEFLVKITGQTDSELLRKALDVGHVDNAIVQSFEGTGDEYSVRVGGEQESKVTKGAVEAALKSAFADKYQILKSDYIGPTIGAELRSKALIAMIVALIGILIYVSYRFEFAFALGAVIALFHDVIVAMGGYLLAGHTLNMGTVAAALTIVGYSVNDTIVIFDRVREEILKNRDFDLATVMNGAINFTLSRTIVTSVLTLFSAFALLIWGGGAIADLSLFLVVGIVAGCYSTIFIASPIVLYWERFRTRKHAS